MKNLKFLSIYFLSIGLAKIVFALIGLAKCKSEE